MSSRRRSDDNRASTASAPEDVRFRIDALREIASERKLLLFDCAVARLAPFSPDGRSIWELLPGFNWFSTYRQSLRGKINGHEAIETVERMADNEAESEAIQEARWYLRYTEWAAESDRFGYDKNKLIGSELRYGVAYWIENLADVGPELRNIFDFYLAAYSGCYYAWAREEPLHPDHQSVSLSLLNDIFGNPFRPVALAPSWRTSITLALAESMYASRDFAAMPVLADALEEAGCDQPDILAHGRGPGPHVRGCWVVDLVLGKQ